VKFDVSGSDPADATRDFEPPKPGVYKAKVAEINPGFSRDDDGKPDKSRPRLEVVYRIQDKKYANAPVWDYLSFSDASQWKLDQFLQAVGISSKTKRKGEFDTDKVAGKKIVKVRIIGETRNGAYRARVGGVFKYNKDDDEELDSEEDVDEEVEDEDVDDTEEEDETEESEDEDTDEEEDESPDLDSLGAEADEGDDAAAEQLTAMAEDNELDPDEYATWAELATAIQEAEGGGEGEDEDDSDGYDDMSLKELKEELESRDLKTTGSKAALVKRLRENDESEDPF
jgi:hypothetical protein